MYTAQRCLRRLLGLDRENPAGLIMSKNSYNSQLTTKAHKRIKTVYQRSSILNLPAGQEREILNIMSLPNLEEFSPGSQQVTGLKADLKHLIHQKRGSEYDDEDLWGKEPKYEPTDDDMMRAEQRKENNKAAAQKSRAKKRNRLDFLEKRAKELKAQREHLLREKQQLNDERERLKKVLVHHANTCPGVKEIIRERLAIY